jgi:Cellulose binding domain
VCSFRANLDNLARRFWTRRWLRRVSGSLIVMTTSCSFPNFEFSEQEAGLAPSHCSNQLQDVGETAIDCGGTCGPCAAGRTCVASTDCAGSQCINGVCQNISCTDQTQSGTETDVDCGGGGCTPCAPGQRCSIGTDCDSGVCASGTCSQSTCSDKVKNGPETDTDCGGTCPTCAPGQRCSIGTDCAGGNCTDGTCSLVCLDGKGNCDGDATNGCETNFKTDADHCGACDARCNVPHATARCSGGKCQVETCTPPFADCDGDPANGCETNTSSDAKNCGGCGTTCVDINGIPACGDSKCQITCTAGYADCDNDRSNGCEKRTDNDVNNCGACGKICSAGNGTPWCNMGKCGVSSCPVGFGDCNGDPSDGCEVNLASDVDNCKSCGALCVAANGTAKCAASACAIASCDASHMDCTGNYADGCETSIATDANNCGGCGTVCTIANGTAQCQNKVCKVKTCTAPWADCTGTGTSCQINTSTSTGNCGGCGSNGLDCNAVYGPLHATGQCVSGGCELNKCVANFGDCNLSPDTDGCEASLQSSNSHCGACGTPCQAPHGTNTCAMGVCMPSCGTAYGSCDGDPNTGCEAVFANDTNNCGACGAACQANHTSSNNCVGAACAPMCLANYADCDTSRVNGCETPTSSDPNNCGGCKVQCLTQNATGTMCASGACVPSCNDGWGACSSPSLGCTTNLTNDGSNCGKCGTVCTSGQQCVASKCVPSGFSVLYGVQSSGATSPYIECELHAKNSGTSSAQVSELKLRYYFTDEVHKAPQITINWSHISTSGANAGLAVSAAVGTLVPAATGADTYVELALSSSHSLLGPGESADFSWRLNGPNQATDIYTQTNDYSFDSSKTSVTSWGHVVLLQNSSVLWGTLP